MDISFKRLGKFGIFIRKFWKVCSENQEHQKKIPRTLGNLAVRPKKNEKKDKGLHLIVTVKLGNCNQIKKFHLQDQKNSEI